MVFSLFKKVMKAPEKMPEPKIAVPKVARPGVPAGSGMPPAPARESAAKPGSSPLAAGQTSAPSAQEKIPVELPDLDFSPVAVPAVAPVAKAPLQAPAPSAQAAKALPLAEFDDGLMDDFENSFTNSSVMDINILDDQDPLQAEVEQAAMLFANGQDAGARAVLEACLQARPGPESERLWHMLLDLLQVTGDRPAFERHGLEFVRHCEKSPPAWRGEAPAAAPSSGGALLLALQGVVTEGNDPQLLAIGQALARKQPLRIDFGRLAGCGDGAAQALHQLLAPALKKGAALSLDNIDVFVQRLAGRLEVGKAEHEAAWWLLLDCYQFLGNMEAFEEKAVDYAVTFEVSPPSWEAPRLAPLPPVLAELARPSDVVDFSGDLRNCRFEELPAFLELHDRPVLDFSRVKRVDFFSAGQLRNVLAPFRKPGKELIIRNPHHLIAELFAVVGLTGVARIVVPKS